MLSWNYLEAVSGSSRSCPSQSWSYIGAVEQLSAVLRLPWAVLGAILELPMGPSWKWLGAVLEPSWNHLGAARGDAFGAAWELSWSQLGAVLGHLRIDFALSDEFPLPSRSLLWGSAKTVAELFWNSLGDAVEFYLEPSWSCLGAGRGYFGAIVEPHVDLYRSCL